MAAVLAFLAAHRGQVSPITIHLWGNDIDPVAEACKGDFACIKKRAPAALAAFQSRFGDILSRLRTAAPTADIVVNGAWNFNVDDLAKTDPIFRSIDAAIRRAAIGAKARVVDLYSVVSPQGNVTRQKARICAYTFICSRGDPHPTDAGYRAIAGAVWAASGTRHAPYPGGVRVYLVRHAEAAPGEPDDLRPLTPGGRAAARDLGIQLAADGVRPHAVLSSPLLRARETAEELAQALGCEAETDERLAPGATAASVSDAVAGRGDEVVVVGHQPDCGLIAAEISGVEPPRFPPAGFVVLEL